MAHQDDNRHRDFQPHFSKTLPHSHETLPMGKRRNRKITSSKVICISRSIWSAPIIEVPKGDGGKCLVIDYRALNKVTRKFTWPMPKVEDIFSKLNRATYFTTLDLQAGYHHIPLDKSSIPKQLLTHLLGSMNTLKFHLD